MHKGFVFGLAAAMALPAAAVDIAFKEATAGVMDVFESIYGEELINSVKTMIK